MKLIDGLVDQVLGELINSSGAQAQSMMQTALQVLQANGGIDGMVEKLRQAGYGSQAASWVGTGANEPISPDAVQDAMGSAELGALASKLGMGRGELLDGLASLLPQVIDTLTPQGRIPDNHSDVLAQALSMLRKSRRA